MSTDDRNSDHDLKTYLDGRDGVSTAYRKTAHDEPPAALDALILKAARQQAGPSTETWYAARKPYALAASVMIAVAGLSLYLGTLDELVSSAEMQQADAVEAVEFQRQERAEPPPQEEEQEAERRRVAVAPSADLPTRQLPAPAPTISAANAPAAPSAAAGVATDALARRVESPVIVIDGPLLESIEAEAAAAQAVQQEIASLEEIQVTGSRIVRRRDAGDLSYRESREDWLDEIRSMTDELDQRSRLITARRSANVLEEQLEEEIDLFLEAYPDTDIDAELEE
jgi:hypothetical protein